MDFYYSGRIDTTSLITDFLLVVVTTGVTYFLFSVLPMRKRKRMVANRLRAFRENLKEEILSREFDFKPTYRRYEEKVIPEGQGEDEAEICLMIDFANFPKFISNFMLNSIFPTYFNHYWQGNELINLVNTLVMDDEKYINISINLSKLYQHLDHIDVLMGDRKKDGWGIKDESKFIESDGDRELVHLVVGAMEETYDISREVIKSIDVVLGEKS